MRVEKVDFKNTGCFSPIFLDYLEEKESLKDFYNYPPKPESFQKQIKIKEFNQPKRDTLNATLTSQYNGLEISDKVKDNLEKLKQENTYTITTGHQLNIFTGPLFFHYKIITVINLCRQLTEKYPDYNFIPVYWMSTEDHDFEEISNFQLDGHKFEWKTDQKGPVGKFDPSSLKDILEKMPGKNEIFKEAYLKSKTLAEAVRSYVNEIYGEKGLLIIDGNNAVLKSVIKEIIKDDLKNHRINELAETTSKKLENMGYKAQVFPREINCFYLEENLRSRIVEENGNYKVLNTDLSFSKKDILNLADKSPEKFSPNALLRPIYQESILPNLAMVGGPAEVAYWLQLKSSFDHYNVTFPIIYPRNCATVITAPIYRKFKKIQMDYEDLFADTETLKKKLIKSHSENDLHLDKQKTEFSETFDKVKEQAAKIDPTLEQHINAENKKLLNTLGKIEKKMVRAEKRNHENAISHLESVINFTFPGKNLQERILNYLNFYYNNPDFLEEVLQNLDPFDQRFNILIEE